MATTLQLCKPEAHATITGPAKGGKMLDEKRLSRSFSFLCIGESGPEEVARILIWGTAARAYASVWLTTSRAGGKPPIRMPLLPPCWRWASPARSTCSKRTKDHAQHRGFTLPGKQGTMRSIQTRKPDNVPDQESCN